VTPDRYPNSVAVTLAAVSTPLASVTTALEAVRAASLLTEIAALSEMSLFTITFGEMLVVPFVAIVTSPVGVTAVGVLLALPTQILPLASVVGLTIPLPLLGMCFLVPSTVHSPPVTAANNLAVPERTTTLIAISDVSP